LNALIGLTHRFAARTPSKHSAGNCQLILEVPAVSVPERRALKLALITSSAGMMAVLAIGQYPFPVPTNSTFRAAGRAVNGPFDLARRGRP
jgi:hypothetical protein